MKIIKKLYLKLLIIPFVALIGVSNSYSCFLARLITTNVTIVCSIVAHTNKKKRKKRALGAIMVPVSVGINLLSSKDDIEKVSSFASSAFAYSAGSEIRGYIKHDTGKHSEKRDKHFDKFLKKVLIANGITILGSIFSLK
ncbi:hypothetical protein KAH94_00335 [bacterium]|nr:hypothetical protein [bacterium]